ncbi:ORF6N domain-containing protein [bacterium]|nr:ORF6N domain-containing protein [bacterium]
MTSSSSIIPSERIESRILLIRGKKVMLDTDLAELYGVQTKVLNQAVKRNIGRFPTDFLFKLTKEEKHELVTNCDRFALLKHSTVMPNAFTEHGAIMAASVLNSKRAIAVSVFVVRAFVKLREMVATTRELEVKFKELEGRIESHDEQIQTLFTAIRQLMTPPEPEKKVKMGFDSGRKKNEK